MGNPKQKWTADEEAALLNGVAKYGPGRWKSILLDPDFAPSLTQRSNIDLKVEACPTPTKLSMISEAWLAKLRLKRAIKYGKILLGAYPLHSVDCEATEDKWRNLSVGSGQGSRDRSRGAKRVKPLVKEGKPEKVKESSHYNGHRVNRDGALGTKTRTPKQKGVKPKHKYNQALVEAAAAAAYKVVEAENRSYLAAEAVKELERVSEIAEYTYGMLQLLKEINEHCLQGEVALLA